MTTVPVGLAMVLAGLAAGETTEAGRGRYLIYLHGRIVQERQSARPRNSRFGYYELEKILQAFRRRGFIATGEILPKSASVSDSADRVVSQIRRLLESGVPAECITVVGRPWARPSRSSLRLDCTTQTCASAIWEPVCPEASPPSSPTRGTGQAGACSPSAKPATIRPARAHPGRLASSPPLGCSPERSCSTPG